MGESRKKFNGSLDGILAAFLLALAGLSLHGTLDHFAYGRLAETTTESVGIYALSRSINAGISMFQSFEGGPIVASIQFGQVLDPINDAVERLSSTMVWAIGSLMLQRLMLEVTSTAVFRWSFFCIGIATFAVLLAAAWEPCRSLLRFRLKVSEAGLTRCRGLLVRIFVVGAIIRFIVPVFVIVSALAAEMFLGATVQEHRGRLSVLSADVGADPGLPVVSDQDLPGQRDQTLAKLRNMEASLATRQRETRQLDDAIRKLREKTGWRGRLPEWLGGESPGQELSAAMARQEDVDRAIEDIQTQIDRGKKNLQCIKRRMAGETCASLLDKLSTASYGRIATIVDKATSIVTSIVRLSIAIAIKNILFPIVFLMIALKYILPIIRYTLRKTSAWQRDLKELPTSLGQLD